MKDMNPFGEPLPENRAALEVKEDGQIWLNDGRQSILVSDQEVARELLFLKHCIFPKEIALKEVAGIYPIPDLKWEAKWMNKKGGVSDKPEAYKVAVISLPESEKAKQECSFKTQCEDEPTAYKEQFCGCYNERKRLLIEMMQEDEKNGMYEEPDIPHPHHSAPVVARFYSEYDVHLMLSHAIAHPKITAAEMKTRVEETLKWYNQQSK